MIRPKVKLGVSVFMNEDGSYGIQTTSQNVLTVLGLLMIGIKIIQDRLTVKKEESSIVVPEMTP